MARESAFVGVAHRVAAKILRPPLSVRRGAALLYEVTVDDRLELTVNPKSPTRGESAFQTDLCVFEATRAGVELPRVVMEFKPNITTHDVLTYSAKARKHKQVYPYLRYGLIISEIAEVPRRFFAHNEALDFALALAGTKPDHRRKLLARLVKLV